MDGSILALPQICLTVAHLSFAVESLGQLRSTSVFLAKFTCACSASLSIQQILSFL